MADRLIGLVALMLLGIGALSLAPAFAGREALRIVTIALHLAVTVIGGVSLSGRTGRVATRAGRRLTHGASPEGFWRFVGQAGEALRAYRGAPGALLRALGVGLVLQTLTVSINYLACRAVGIDISVINIVWVAAVVSLAVALPISIAGLGARETAYVTLLGQCGVSAAQALGVSPLMLAIYLLSGLLGGLVQLLGLGTGRSRPDARVATSEEANSENDH